MKTVKVISLYQPFATLLAYGIKQNETRPGPTNHTFEKGKYLIQAGKKWNNELERLCMKEPFYSALKKIAWSKEEFRKQFPNMRFDFDIDLINDEFVLPFGCIVGEFEVKECATTCGGGYDAENNKSFRLLTNGNKIEFSSNEYHFGDYSLGRSIWIGQNHKVLKNPISYKGGQGYYQNFKGNYNELKFL